MRISPLLSAALLVLASAAWADKVIMKDGKIYQGRIMGETQDAILISNAPLDPKPRFLDLKDVLTIVRESRPAEKPSSEEGRFASANFGILGEAFSSNTFSFSPAAGFYAGASFRIHPALDVGGELDYLPTLAGGGLTVTDGVNTRGYETFYEYHGGFSFRLFPFYRKQDWRWEPYLTTGFRWNRLVPKGSGDALKGSSVVGGAGVMIPWFKPLYWDFRFLYEHTRYDTIKFLTIDQDFPGVTQDAFTLTAGLSYRFL